PGRPLGRPPRPQAPTRVALASTRVANAPAPNSAPLRPRASKLLCRSPTVPPPALRLAAFFLRWSKPANPFQTPRLSPPSHFGRCLAQPLILHQLIFADPC